jgi:hypothetical protein
MSTDSRIACTLGVRFFFLPSFFVLGVEFEIILYHTHLFCLSTIRP